MDTSRMPSSKEDGRIDNINGTEVRGPLSPRTRVARSCVARARGGRQSRGAESHRKRRFAALLAWAALLLTPAYIAVTGAPEVDWVLVLAYLVVGLFAAGLAALTICIAGPPLVGWLYDRRTSS